MPQHFEPHWDLSVDDLRAPRRRPRARPAARPTIERGHRRLRARPRLRGRRWSTLSGGEQARVLLAIVLVVDPPILLADEPAASLDIRHRLDVIARPGPRGRRPALDRGGARSRPRLRFFDRVIVLHRGRIVADAPAKDLIADPLLDSVLRRALRALEDRRRLAVARHQGLRCRRVSRPALIAVAIEAAVGYPDAIYRAIGHPVGWIGQILSWCDRTLNNPSSSFETRRLWGVVTLVLILAVVLLSGWAIMWALTQCLPAIAACCSLPCSPVRCWPSAASTSMSRAVADGARARGLQGGRAAVSHDRRPRSRARSTRPASPAPRSRASPRTSPTASSRRRSGSRRRPAGGAAPTRRSTPPTA